MTGGSNDSSREQLLAELGSRLGALAQAEVPLGPLTTYRVGGRAGLLVRLDAEDDLRHLARSLADLADLDERRVPVLVVGKGSNLLVADEGFRGLVIVLGEAFAGVTLDGTHVRVGAAASLPVVARKTAAAGLTGFEWAVGVPGSVGGAVRMNAGGHGSDMAACLVGVRALDLRSGQDGPMRAAQLELGYRHSSLASHQLVVWADLRLAPGNKAEAEREISEIVRWRREHQPGGANAGSVFTNPVGDAAGRLIDAAGAKGLRRGTAEVSPKHANFIQADPGGRAADVLATMVAVTDQVREAFGVELVPETRLAGFQVESLPATWLSANPQLLIES